MSEPFKDRYAACLADIEKEVENAECALYVDGKLVAHADFWKQTTPTGDASQGVRIGTSVAPPDKIEIEVNGKRYDVTHYLTLSDLTAVAVTIPFTEWPTKD